MFTVYVLRNQAGQLYVGQTIDLERRLFEHQNGLGRWTRNRGPWEVVLTEQYTTRADAMRRERNLKAGRLNQEIRRVLAEGQSGSFRGRINR